MLNYRENNYDELNNGNSGTKDVELENYTHTYKNERDDANSEELNTLYNTVSNTQFINKNKHLRDHENENEWVVQTLDYRYEGEWALGRLMRKLWDGPQTPRDTTPEISKHWSLLHRLDQFPNGGFKKRFTTPVRMIMGAVYCALWFGVVWSFIYPYLFKRPVFHSRDGSNTRDIRVLACNSRLHWFGENNECGLNAKDCMPFDNKDFYVRCPAFCDHGGQVYSPLAVGAERIQYKSYVIGGGSSSIGGDGAVSKDHDHPNELSSPYRADSFPCVAGVHAGVVSPIHGACMKVSMSGAQMSFQPALGVTGRSIGFDTFFPSSFVLAEVHDSIWSGCYDPRVLVVTINVLLGAGFFYMADSEVGYWVVCLVAYWSVVLVFDPPMETDPRDAESVYELVSVGFQRLLPLCFVLYVLWSVAIKRCLKHGSPVLKIVFWYPMLWIGTLNNVTFDRLPIDRLTLGDMKQQPGALLTVSILIACVAVAGMFQAYAVWKAGRFQKLFKFYAAVFAGLVILGSLPGLSLRVHHYMMGMILVPGCSTRGSFAYLLQGLCIGLILSGIGRWDFASILETRRTLLRGGPGDSLGPPQFVFHPEDKFTLHWKDTAPHQRIGFSHDSLSSYSLLVNDVEVYVGKNSTVTMDALMAQNSHFKSLVDGSLDYQDNVKLYLRVAYTNEENLYETGDYTNAAVYYYPSGEWTDPLPGVS